MYWIFNSRQVSQRLYEEPFFLPAELWVRLAVVSSCFLACAQTLVMS